MSNDQVEMEHSNSLNQDELRILFILFCGKQVVYHEDMEACDSLMVKGLIKRRPTAYPFVITSKGSEICATVLESL